MIKTLISLNADLASSIALRYCCRLAELADMKLQTIHVEETGKEGYPPGSGWVRNTWEKGLLQTAGEEISQLINSEKSSCSPLIPPIIRLGESDDELLHEIEAEPYDLYVEGILNAYNSQDFQNKVRSKLYRYVTCPILVVKNLVNPERVALLLEDNKDLEPLVNAFLKVFNQSKLTPDIIHITFQRSGKSGYREKIEPSDSHGDGEPGELLIAARTMLAERDCHANESWIMRDTPKELGEILSDYGLVAACLPRRADKKNRVVELLNQVPSAAFLCKR